MTWSLSKSTDGGATWGAKTDIVSGTRHYGRCVKTSESRLDFAFTDGSYAEDGASVYHLYYEGGDWFASDGTDIGDPPFNLADDATLAYDGSVGAGARSPQSVAKVGDDIVITYPIQTGTPTNHVGEDSDYGYSRWNGATWTGRVVETSVGPPSFDFPEGGVAVDPADLDRVAASVEVGGVWRMFLYTTDDDGATWSATQLTEDGDDDVFPRWVSDHDATVEFIWSKGGFVTENDFSFGIEGYGAGV
jgi:hypothetical protein